MDAARLMDGVGEVITGCVLIATRNFAIDRQL